MHSPDLNWWWDGEAWQSAISPDGVYWFDGIAWQPRPTHAPAMKAVAIVGIAVGLGLALVIAFLVIYAVTSGDAHDSRSLDDESIRANAASGCVAVTRALNETGADRIERIDNGNAAIAQLVATMEALGASKLDDDPPATEWLKDWRRLTDARTEFAAILSDGNPHPFSIPQTDDGYPITIRMTDVAPLECERAVELASQP